MTRCALYRQYDATGALLYIGVTADPETRATGHRSASVWGRSVARTVEVWYASRQEALTAEAAAIRAEQPPFNVVHSGRPLKRRQKLAELQLGVEPGRLIVDYVEPRHRGGEGESLASIARDISARTGDLVTGSTLTRWYNADREAGLLDGEAP